MTDYQGCQKQFFNFLPINRKKEDVHKTKKEMYINLNVTIRLNELKSWETFGMLSPLLSMLVRWQMVVNVCTHLMFTCLWLYQMQDRAHTWLFYAADSCLNETMWKTDTSADLLKAVRNAMWVFFLVLFSFGCPEVLVIK